MKWLIFLGVVAFASSAHALSCLPCDETECANVTCETTVVKDPCFCCDECSKGLGEQCGGPWDIEGLCDEEQGLVCDRFVAPGDIAFNSGGRCVRNGTQDICSFPKIFRECASACQDYCNQPLEPVVCTQQCVADNCVCGPGFIRKSLTNRTCVPETECESPSTDPVTTTPATPPPLPTSTTTTCDFPKIFSECATACPATCGNPFPFLCTRNCALDPCVCPQGFMLRSLTDRRCIRDYECADFEFCERDCPELDIRGSPTELLRSWSCYLSQWKCTTYKWKMGMTKWWVESCNSRREDMDDLWEDLKNTCDSNPLIRCKDSDAARCSTDAFGCHVCECADGRYEDPSQLMAAWKVNYAKYHTYFEIYQRAKGKCVSACGLR